MKYTLKNFSYCVFMFLLTFNFILGQTEISPLEKKISEMLKKMTLEEKIGQMTQVDIDALAKPEDITEYSLGSLLAGGNSEPKDISAKGWAAVHDLYQSYALKSRLAIPLVFGVDAVHGHNNVQGAVIFPHNIGLGATRDPNLVELAMRTIAKEIKATGIPWTFAPCFAVARNEKWGRTYESFGEDPDLIKMMAIPSVQGLQGKDADREIDVLACAKHYLGDGGTTHGIDQGNTECDEATLRKLHLPGYEAAIKAKVGSVMISYSSWNGQKMHGHSYLINDVLKKELGFEGFIVSDWAAIDQLPGDYKSDIEVSINAGLDMIMIPNGPGKENNYVEFINKLKELVQEGKVSMQRIDDAVRRILRIKALMGLWKKPYSDPSLLSQLGSQEHREVARQCVRKSLVLLKNDNKTLPLVKNAKKIFVAGKSADDLGNQCGGWTISWQGASGNVIQPGTTILQAIQNTVSKETQVVYSKEGENPGDAEVAVVVIGETPYAEMFGDRKDLSLSEEDIKVWKRVKETSIPTVVILVCGRPLLIQDILEKSNAFIVAWLPGTEGQGVADVLFGDYSPTGKLPHSWPKTMDQIPVNLGDKNYSPLFEYGFGLTY